MKLSNLSQGKDNNFNLIRIVSALAVLITHSFALATGSGDAEPFRLSLGMTMGTIAVDIFLITSGFLVTASLLTRQSVIEFIWARVLRILPALLVMLTLTVFGLGVYFTTLPLVSYLTESKTYLYLIKCASLITGVAYNLPGVFDGNPYNNAVNGSLWTMPYEVKMYMLLAFTWLVLSATKMNKFKLFKFTIVSVLATSGILFVACNYSFPTEFSRFSFMFFSGAAIYVLRKYIYLSHSLFWLALIALLWSTFINAHIFFIFYVLTIPYILFYLAYIPSGDIRKYNLLGDYSYGVYIYAFPVQQSVAAMVPGVSVLSMIFISATATLLLAVISWHVLERRALGLKNYYVGHTKKILTFSLRSSS